MTTPTPDSINTDVVAYGQAQFAAGLIAQQTIDQSQISGLTQQIASLNQQITGFNQQITSLDQQIATLHAQLVALRPPLAVGAHVAGVPFATAEQRLGPIPITRVFHPGALPTSFAADAKNYPDGTVLVVSYKTPQTNIAAYAASAPAGKLILSYHHEPENDYANGAQYVAEFVKEYATIKAAAPNVKVPHIAMTYQYSGGRHGQDGSFLPPATSCDAYYADNYVGKGNPTLANDPQFQGWYQLVKGLGRPLGLTEYGVGNTPADPVRATARVATFNADAQWLLANPAFELLLYWYSTGSAGQDWRFTDQPSIAAWQNLVTTLTKS